ncbi:unnamed protein product [Rotaria sordida]|uniref:Uncharacterized protein n=1 Tax=Rotaria sordida TaxID=392033 RepID=A0A815PNX1_9BILA|nr:unnamed protein product [Rotaria sordida]CAF1451423.1 unnamed protein product [Rotaria sordida]CAF1489137.1 unnamed protein product [Rotaria sordida]CAF1639101.1 unnamed protein product [Rotaria sordida]CAF3949002.1 unnamed protein product [Rotaria sordida]
MNTTVSTSFEEHMALPDLVIDALRSLTSNRGHMITEGPEITNFSHSRNSSSRISSHINEPAGLITNNITNPAVSSASIPLSSTPFLPPPPFLQNSHLSPIRQRRATMIHRRNPATNPNEPFLYLPPPPFQHTTTAYNHPS